MASSNNLDALSQDGEPPFVHPGHNFDDTPEGVKGGGKTYHCGGEKVYHRDNG